MVNKKVEMKRIEGNAAREVTFFGRRTSVMKKANELSVLCDAKIGLIIYSSSGELFQYCTEPLSMEQIIEKYETSKESHVYRKGESSHEMEMLKQENLRLEVEIKRYLGEDMSSLQGEEDLTKLEEELENSISKVRNHQNELLQQQKEQMENLRTKGRILEDENNNLSTRIQELQEVLEFEKAVMEADEPMQHQPVMDDDHFPFFEECIIPELASPILPHLEQAAVEANEPMQHQQVMGDDDFSFLEECIIPQVASPILPHLQYP